MVKNIKTNNQIYLKQLFLKVELMKKRIEKLKTEARNNRKVFIGGDPTCGENEVFFIYGNTEKIIPIDSILSFLGKNLKDNNCNNITK